MTITKRPVAAAVLLATTLEIAPIASSEIELPELTEGGSSLMSSYQEKLLGDSWLRQFRGSVPLSDDPLVYEYVEQLLMKLATHSELDDKELKLVIVDNRNINAFAVPGGIVGINTGLLLNAETEGQLASVVAHELAHLSQQHFARSVEAARQSNLVSLTGMLAGIILAATAGGDAATAAIATSQAAAIDSQLRYSRNHEREADRLGMKTLAQSGYEPAQAAAMFRRMQDNARLYGSSVPEFLLTHPITKSRISDAENRARQYQKSRVPGQQSIVDSLDYQLIRTRLHVESFDSAALAVEEYQKRLSSINESKSATMGNDEIVARYALAMSHNKNRDWKNARKTLDPVLSNTSFRLIYSLLDIDIDKTAGQIDTALRRLRDLYALSPKNYPVGMALAKTAMKAEAFPLSERVLKELSELYPRQSDIWYLLAEAHGLANNISELHYARAEFFFLRNNLDQSQFHLQQALRLARNDVTRAAKIKQRLREIAELKHLSRR
jgi:predicted Zn-dependent protease